MMGGPANGRMFGGLNNISNTLMKNLGGMGGGGGAMGGLGGLGNIMGMMGGGGGMGGLGGLGNIMGMMGGGGSMGGLGGLGNIMGMMGGNNSGNNSGNNGGFDLNSILSQLGNMQQPPPPPPNPPPKQQPEEPIREAQFQPTDEPNNDFAEERFQEPRQQQEQAGNGMPNINPELLQMLKNFLGNQNQQNQNQQNQNQQNQRQQNQRQARPQNQYRQAAKGGPGQQNAYRKQAGEQKQSAPEKPAPRNCDTCFDCPLNCPRAGLKLPEYAQVRQLAKGWQRY